MAEVVPPDFTGIRDGVYYKDGKPQGRTSTGVVGAVEGNWHQDENILYYNNRQVGWVAPDGSVWDTGTASGQPGRQLGAFKGGKFYGTDGKERRAPGAWSTRPGAGGGGGDQVVPPPDNTVAPGKMAELKKQLSDSYGICLLYTSPSPRD